METEQGCVYYMRWDGSLDSEVEQHKRDNPTEIQGGKVRSYGYPAKVCIIKRAMGIDYTCTPEDCKWKYLRRKH